MQNIVILGAGESGVGVALLAKKHGCNVFVSDIGKVKNKYKEILIQNSISFEEGKHTEKKIINADEIIKSPGISENSKIIQIIRQQNIPVISEIEFASRYTDAKIIAITGSNGKTTTANLLWYILSSEGFNVGLAGNVGQSFAWSVAKDKFDVYVLEISSFQLDDCYNFKADIAILTNITPDHLDRYDNIFQNYIDSKFRIINNQTEDDYFIYCADDIVTTIELKRKTIKARMIPFSVDKNIENGACLSDSKLIIRINNIFEMYKDKLSLKGTHNVYNSMAAGIAGKLMQIRNNSLRECLTDFKEIEHRLEKYLCIHGISFINDSKATNTNSAWYALESMEQPTVWIVGGVDKGNDYTLLRKSVISRKKIKAIVCLGVDNAKIHESFDGVVQIYDTQSMKEAVQTSYYLADDGENVLLSPACASFDLFESYEDRGNKFKEAVRNL